MTSRQWTEGDVPDMTGKVVIVTGGNGGIGYYTAKIIASNGAKVYIASRESTKSHDAIKRFKEETGKEVTLLPVNLSDLKDVRRAAEEFLKQESKLDVLVNNAGVMAQPINELTKDGYDGQFGVNVLAHFHFTTILLPALLAAESPRVVNLSSIGHNLAPRGGFWWNKLKGPKQGTRWPVLEMVERYRYYGMSKLGNILFTNELVRRYGDRGLISIAVHPGAVASDLARYHNFIVVGFLHLVCVPVNMGAITSLFAATAPEAAKLSGKYLVPYAQVGQPSALSQDKDLAEKMWEWCENETKNY